MNGYNIFVVVVFVGKAFLIFFLIFKTNNYFQVILFKLFIITLNVFQYPELWQVVAMLSNVYFIFFVGFGFVFVAGKIHSTNA